jgi:hypothetical protein
MTKMDEFTTRERPISLPWPKFVDATVAVLDTQSPEQTLEWLFRRRAALRFEAEVLTAEIEAYLTRTVCGDDDSTVDVESFNVPQEFSAGFAASVPAVGELQWLDTLKTTFKNPGESPGDVNNQRWGSGALIANNYFLTAGHCFAKTGMGHTRPSRNNGQTIEPDQMATLMKVNFNHQIDSTTQLPHTDEVSFPVLELIECSFQPIDYAIVRLGANAAGKYPSDLFRELTPAASDATAPTNLCIIQQPLTKKNPHGFKTAAIGPLFQVFGSQIQHLVDAHGGSSGAPILTPNGLIVGVHTNDGCSDGGANYGTAIGTIRAASIIL